MNSTTHQPVEVEREVFEGIEAVRQSGLANMFHRDCVAEIASELGFYASADWMRENPGLYPRAIIRGVEVTE